MITRDVSSIGGQAVDAARLTAGEMEVGLLSYGALTQSWRIADRNIVLGYDDPAAYEADPYYHGAIAGRVANRIENARFALAGKDVRLPANYGPHTLHGGPDGLNKRHWRLQADTAANSVRLTYSSPDGESGFPGRADFDVTVTLTDKTLVYDMRAEVDRPTPISLVQHNYYNLTGGEIWDHVLSVPAEEYLVSQGDKLIQTGKRAPVAGTRNDFRVARSFADADHDKAGIDVCLPLQSGAPGAVLSAPGGPTLSFFTGQAGMHVYDSNTLGPPFAPFTAICLEPEAFPGALNHAHFPSIIATPDNPYRQILTIEVD